MVDGNGVAPSEILACARQERLGEEKSGNPEDWGWFILQPPAKGDVLCVVKLSGRIEQLTCPVRDGAHPQEKHRTTPRVCAAT